MSAQDKPVVLFGGGGFLGRQVAQELLTRGYPVRIAQRDVRATQAVRSLGNVGQTQFVAMDITDEAQVAAALAGAGAAVNLVGLLKGPMQAVHVGGAANIAKAAAAAGLDALVHVSAIGADPASPSAYGRTKGEGEAAVRAAFPKVTIVRPSILFGQNDGFTNRFAQLIVSGAACPLLHVVPLVRGETRFQPIHVGDVAAAIAMAVDQPGRFGGETFELGGPDVLTLAQINRWIAGEIGRKPNFLPIADPIAKAMAALTGWAPGAPLTTDQYRMLLTDNVVAHGAKGIAAFGIRPAPLAAIAPAWLAQYRKQGRFGHAARA